MSRKRTNGEYDKRTEVGSIAECAVVGVALTPTYIVDPPALFSREGLPLRRTSPALGLSFRYRPLMSCGIRVAGLANFVKGAETKFGVL